MSGILGIFNRNGKPVDRDIADKMLDAMSYWDPDERDVWINGSVSLGHTMLWNVPESKYEHLPLRKDGYVFTMDARIDNREELVKKIDLPDRPFTEIGDSEFILGAYKKWGEKCPEHLLGDFVFVIWDEEKKQLFCTRDHVGIKPFYYYLNNDFFIFSNDIRCLLTHPNVPINISDQMIMSYMYEIEQKDITFYENIKKLQPACSVIITKNNFCTFKYWKAEESKQIYFENFEDYVKQLNDLLHKSIKSRIRSCYTLASHLSGGLDSSAVSVLAARELKKQKKTLLSYSWLHKPAKEDDSSHFEWANAERIAHAEKINHNYINMDIDIFNDIYSRLNITFMDRLDFWNEFAVRELVAGENARTILSGWGGDELVSYNGGVSYNAEIFWKGKIFDALSHYNSYARKYNIEFKKMIKIFLKELVFPIFSKKYFDILYDFFSSSFYSDIDPLVNFKDDYIERIKSVKLQANSQPRKLATRAEQLNRFYLGTLNARAESWSSSAFEKRIEYRFPLLDKRLVEFALGVPIELYINDGYDRYLFRSSLGGIVPDDIIWSETKLENERSNRHNRIMFEFLKNWLNSYQRNQSVPINNSYIDTDKLIHNIRNTLSDALRLDDITQIKNMMIAGKTILLLNALKK